MHLKDSTVATDSNIEEEKTGSTGISLNSAEEYQDSGKIVIGPHNFFQL